MAVQMYLVHPKNPEDDSVRQGIVEWIARRGGFVLMATSYGSLIVAMDEKWVELARAQPAVDFIGGVTLNPNGPLAAHLQQIFAQNIAAQLAERGLAEPAAKPEDRLPPGYRPWTWTRQSTEPEGGG